MHLTGPEVRLARSAIGIRQFDLARRARMSAARLSLFERGQVVLTRGQSARLQRVLGRLIRNAQGTIGVLVAKGSAREGNRDPHQTEAEAGLIAGQITV